MDLHSHCLDTARFKKTEIQLIEELWTEVTEAKHWQKLSFQLSDESIRNKLAVTYPWLKTNAIDSLIRAAAYVWK